MYEKVSRLYLVFLFLTFIFLNFKQNVHMFFLIEDYNYLYNNGLAPFSPVFTHGLIQRKQMETFSM